VLNCYQKVRKSLGRPGVGHSLAGVGERRNAANTAKKKIGFFGINECNGDVSPTTRHNSDYFTTSNDTLLLANWPRTAGYFNRVADFRRSSMVCPANSHGKAVLEYSISSE